MGVRVGVGCGGSVLIVMHGRSLPSHPQKSQEGARRVFTDQGRYYCLHQARSAVRCSARCMKGELHPTKSTTCEAGMHMEDSFNDGLD